MQIDAYSYHLSYIQNIHQHVPDIAGIVLLSKGFTPFLANWVCFTVPALFQLNRDWTMWRIWCATICLLIPVPQLGACKMKDVGRWRWYIYIYIASLRIYYIYIHVWPYTCFVHYIYICIYDYEICQNSPIVNYVEVVHVCFFKPRSPWARGFNLWFIGKRTIWLVTFPMSTYIFRFSWLSRAFTRPTGRFDSNLMSIWPAEIQKHAPAHLLRFYMWSPLIFLGPVILLWRRCAFNTVFVEIPASVARLSGEVFSKRAPNLKHRTTWITWTTYKFLETHHKLRFFSASCWV